MRENVDHISYGEKRGKEIDVCVDGSFFQTRNRWREGTTYNKLKKKGKCYQLNAPVRVYRVSHQRGGREDINGT